MSYATPTDVQSRMNTTLTESQIEVCGALLSDAAILIDTYAPNADDDKKEMVSCSMVARALNSTGDMAVPMGASQGSVSALGYSQSWTIQNGSTGELYLSKTEKRILGVGNSIGSHSPLEDL